MTTVWLALLGTALAQDDALDAHGFRLGAFDGDVRDPVQAMRPGRMTLGEWYAGGALEFAKAPLVYVVPDANGDIFSRDVVLDNVLAANLAGGYTLHERVRVDVGLPVYFTSTGRLGDVGSDVGSQGAALGDLRIGALIAILSPDVVETLVGGGFGLGVVPYVTMPTGAQRKFLGDQSLTGGISVVATEEVGKLTFTGDLGLSFRPSLDLENLNGSDRLELGAAVGYLLAEDTGANLELRLGSPLKKAGRPGTGAPAEGLVSVRHRFDSGAHVLGGFAVGLSPGAGAAAWRVFVGGGFGKIVPVVVDLDGDGILDAVDACIDVPEVVNGYKDDDGCPDILGDVTWKFVDPEGKPIANLTVMIGDKPYTTDAQGAVALKDLIPGTKLGGSVGATPIYFDTAFSSVDVVEGPLVKSVPLDWKPGHVRVIAKDEKGKPVDAVVKVIGRDTYGPIPLGDDGTDVLDVPPGTWTVSVGAEGYGIERRELSLSPGQTSEVVIEVKLPKAKAIITKTEVKILEQVLFDFDKATIKPESFPLLDQVAGILLDYPELAKLEVQGHTDDKGNDAYNLKLSQARTESVMAYLVKKGVAASRLTAVGYGEAQPVVPNKDTASRAENRRVVFKILEQTGAAVQEKPDDGK